MATTLDNKTADSEDWTLLSTADTQAIQCISGKARVIFAATKPDQSVVVKGHPVKPGDWINKSTSGNSYARATSSGATFAITEG
jgi:hypothetical protein